MNELRESVMDQLIDAIKQMTDIITKQGNMIRALHERLLVLEEGATK